MKILSFCFCLLVVFFSLALPLLYLGGSIVGLSLTWSEIYRDLSALFVSLKAALLTATLATFLAFLLAPTLLKKSWFGNAINLSPLLSYVIPGTVLGILVLAGTLRVALFMPLRYTLAILVYAYLCKFLIQSQRITLAGLSQINPHLLDAARSLGASRLRTRLRILLPLLAPSLIFGWMLVFVSAMKELAATLILKFSPGGIEPLSVRIWTYHNEFTEPQRAAFASLLLLVFTLIPFLVIYAFFQPRDFQGAV